MFKKFTWSFFKKTYLVISERNITHTFPQLNIVGHNSLLALSNSVRP